MSRVFDCFMYCNEADALEIRLNELDPVVDHFILCEATRTFDNQPKPLHFLEQSDSFAQFLPKISHIVVDDFPAELASPPELKHFQRNALARGLVDCAPDDIVIVSDVDEIPHPDAIRTFEGPISGLRMRLFYRYLNLEDVGSGPESNRVRSVICRYDYVRSPEHLRALGRSNNVLNRIVDNGGWHFSHLGDPNWLRNNGDSVWDFVPVDASYPAYVVKNRPRYEPLIAQSVLGTRPRGDPFSSIYFEQERPEVLAMVPHDARHVLELGCATGKLAESLKRRQECHITGLEYSARAAAKASTRLDRVIVGDCETLGLESLFQPGEFDCVIAADVLEHLRDPEPLLRRLQPLLTPDASIVVSMPNVRHAGVLEGAVQGYWSYQKWGVLDRTHLRFFTRREIDNMFARLGFEVEERRTVDEPALAEWESLGRPISATFGALSVDGLDEREIREFFVLQWLVRARSAARPRLSLQCAAPDDIGGSLEIDALSLDGMVAHPRVSTAEIEIQELSSKLDREREHVQGVQAELTRRDEQLSDSVREGRRLQAELTRRDKQLSDSVRERQRLQAELTRSGRELANKVREAEDLQRELVQLSGDRDSLSAAYNAVLTSISWRVTGPLRGVGSLSMQLPGRIVAPLRGGDRPGIAPVHATFQEAPETSPVFEPRPVALVNGPNRFPPGGRGRLICMTHVLPYPPRAGNEYRIHHMLSWLAAQGWDVLLLVYPLSDEPITSRQITVAAEQYPNLIVCLPDGVVHHRLRDGGAMLEGLRGTRPRTFAPLLHETEDQRPGARKLLELMRNVCPDLLIELVLHLEAEFDPAVLLAEYVFMTRPFGLFKPGLLKVVDTHDIFSMTQTKVAQYGVDDRLAIESELEAELLERADLLIAIQPDDANSLRTLAPTRQVISVGVDFTLLERVPPPASRPVILLVASGNAYNVKGLRDFLRFAWPLVRKAVPEAELYVIGSVGNVVDPLLPGLRVMGSVDDLSAAYAEARVVINPAIAGTGLKIKTVEALCHLRPIVVWPSGVDGLTSNLRETCHVASDWFDFARHVIELVSTGDGAQALVDRRSELARLFAPESVYEPLETALACL